MRIEQTPLQDCFIVHEKVHGDARGYFIETFNQRDFKSASGLDIQFVQDNHSYSRQDTLRGLHYQLEKTQGKLVRVISGSVFDVAVDLRQKSPSYGKWVGVELSAENHKQLWIPPGLAHGFLVLSPTAEFLYKTTDYYHPQSEVCLAWNDPLVNIQWPLAASVLPNLNAKDAAGLSWEKVPKF